MTLHGVGAPKIFARTPGMGRGAPHPRKRCGWAAAVVCLLAILAPAGAAAQTTTWTGEESSDWGEDPNWTQGEPDGGTDAILDTDVPNPAVVDGHAAATRRLIVGDEGSASLVVQEGGSLESAEGVVGGDNAAVGAVRVAGSGSRWSLATLLIVGEGGTGTLTVEGGAAAAVTAGDARIGYDFDAQGTVTVRDGGSSWTVAGDLVVGADGVGSLAVESGAQVLSRQGVIGFGAGAGSPGTATARGAGSSWTMTEQLLVGVNGTGALSIEGGAAVSSNDSYLGILEGSQGTVVVSGPGSRWTPGGVVVGDAGAGFVTISGGANVETSAAVLGDGSTGEGDVVVRGAGSTWRAAGDLTLGRDGSGALLIAEGGKVVVDDAAGTVTLAAGTLSTGKLSIGGDAGDAPSAPGSLEAAAVAFGDGAGSIVFNHTGSDFVFAPAISGQGELRHLAGTTRLTGSSSYTGVTTVDGGTLLVDGSIGDAPVSVAEGAGLGGSGTIGADVSLASGATLAPGSSVGTLTVTGDVTFAPNSVLEIEVDAAGNSDLIEVSGQVDVQSGAVLRMDAASAWRPFTSYTVVTAAGGVSGTFTVESPAGFSFVDPAVAYEGDAVMLELVRNAVPFAAAGETPNQKAAAAAAESLGPGTPVYDAVAVLDTETAQAAFEQLSGEIHASVQAALLDESGLTRRAVADRFLAGTGRNASSVETFRLESTRGDAIVLRGTVQGDGNAAALDRSRGSLILGVETGGSWHLGAVGGVSRSELEVEARGSTASLQGLHVAGYGGRTVDAANVYFGAALSRHQIDVNRTVRFPGFAEALAAAYEATTTQLFGEVGYPVAWAGGFDAEPFAALAYVGVSAAGFTERGGDAALSSPGNAESATFLTIGVRGRAERVSGGVPLTAHTTLGWRHAFGETPIAQLAFSGSDAFTVAGNPVARGTLLVDARVGGHLTDVVTVGAGYTGRMAVGKQEHGFSVEVGWRF